MSTFELAAELYYLALDGNDATVSAYGEPSLPTDGYYVGGKIPSLVFNNIHEIDRGELAWWLGSNTFVRYYGVWTDQEDGKIYFDGVTHMGTLAGAAALARRRKEIAVWDILNEDEVRVEDFNVNNS